MLRKPGLPFGGNLGGGIGTGWGGIHTNLVADESAGFDYICLENLHQSGKFSSPAVYHAWSRKAVSMMARWAATRRARLNSEGVSNVKLAGA